METPSAPQDRRCCQCGEVKPIEQYRLAGPDLAGVPIYIVCQSSLAHQFGRAEGCEAYTSSSLDLYFADHIPGYCGRGPCIVVNDFTLAEDQTNDLAY